MITLHDVLYIFRIPIRGTQLSSDGEVNYVSQLTSIFNVSDETIRVKCYATGGFHLDKLLDIASSGVLGDPSTTGCYLIVLLHTNVL